MKKEEHKYADLNQLLAQHSEAKAFFDTLPGYVQESIQERPQGVSSYESLCHYAAKLTQGDH